MPSAPERLQRTTSKSTKALRLGPLIVSVATLIVLMVVARTPILSFLGTSLICSQSPESADLILVLGGDFWGPRVSKAAELGQVGFARRVLISGPPYAGQPEGKVAIEFLVKQGYPRNLFEVFSHHAASTVAEAMALRPELTRRGAKRVILVTSSYHSRRAWIVFRLFCPGIRFISVPAPDSHFAADRWWKNPNSRDLFYSEWTKILGSVFIAYPTYRLSHWR